MLPCGRTYGKNVILLVILASFRTFQCVHSFKIQDLGHINGCTQLESFSPGNITVTFCVTMLPAPTACYLWAGRQSPYVLPEVIFQMSTKVIFSGARSVETEFSATNNP